MFLNRKPLPRPCHCRPTLFYSKDLFILLFSGVIYVTPTLSILAIEHSPRNFSFSLAPSPSAPSIFGPNTALFFSFLNQLLLPLPFTAIGFIPQHTRNLSIQSVFLPSYFITISCSNPNVQHLFFLHNCDSD